ncbi:hypothetical protein RAAC3_TM7C00001G0626 [Candidatus Saccharibacteria bacterium RAAC3_TM7_1]|nr:hypothetical protein RAAC3_TM7C00001G0626 [Candidatus Saccharibacteria bacterium RAAC3_TM7_1]HCZ28379.1 penicillin-binding protein 2 [Candidatus Saccharibacteria bacterium]
MFSQFRTHPRLRLLAIITALFMMVFVVRLFYLQVIEHDKYVALARQEQVKRLVIPAKRGEIYMMDDGRPVKVVLNQTVYTMFADPSIMTDKKQVIKAARDVAGGNVVDGYKSLLDNKELRYVVIAKGLSLKQAELVKKRSLNGVGFQAETERVYPENTLAAQTFGFVNASDKGQYGIEEKFNKELEGKDGLLQSITDVSNVPLTIGDQNIDIPAKNGRDIVLTLDRNIQAITEEALAAGLKRTGATNGSAIVMDPQTGKVLATASLPTYNPGKYYRVTNAEAFNNGSISTPYEPGSVMKTFTLATGIDKGAIEPNSTYNNTDYITVSDRTIENLTKGQTGKITFQHAFTWSLNTGMVTVAQRLGDGKSINYTARTALYQYFHDKFHLGENTGIEVSGENSGEIIPPTDAQGNAVRYSNMTFGQGMNLTMLQVAAGFSAVVNGGTYYKPTIIGGSIDSDGQLVDATQKKVVDQAIKPSTSRKMQSMLVKARQAFYAYDDLPGYTIGGKTGTSQTLVDGSYDNNQTIASYLGYGGDNKARYVIMVQVSAKGKAFDGGKDAMPIFTDISNWMINYLKLQPKG